MFKAVFMCNHCYKEVDGRFPDRPPKEWFTVTYHVRSDRLHEYHFCSIECINYWSSKKGDTDEIGTGNSEEKDHGNTTAADASADGARCT